MSVDIQSVKRELKAQLPAITTLVIFFSTFAPSHFLGIQYQPALVLIPFFFWTLIAPGQIGYGLIFIIGVLQDLLEGTPLGVSALLYLIFTTLLLSQKKRVGISNAQITIGAIFVGSTLGVIVIKALILAIIYEMTFSLIPISISWGILIIAYIPLMWVCEKIQKILRKQKK